MHRVCAWRPCGRSVPARAAVADELGARASFVPADVTSADDMNAVFEAATKRGALRSLVHCAGRGGAVRLIEKDGSPGSLEAY
ncbi:hypothetical protein AB4Y43_38835, partial [Paraburkholderia sp. BR10872]